MHKPKGAKVANIIPVAHAKSAVIPAKRYTNSFVNLIIIETPLVIFGVEALLYVLPGFDEPTVFVAECICNMVITYSMWVIKEKI